MKVKLLEPHTIPVGPGNDRLYVKGEIVDLPQGYGPTVLMIGLDDEATSAIAYAKLKAFGRYWWPHGLYPPGYMGAAPLDDPPIPRPIDDNQPVFHFSGCPEYTS